MKTQRKKSWTCAEAAAECGVTPGRIRQIMMAARAAGGEHILGEKHGRSWLFTRSDVTRLRKIVKKRPE